MSTGSGGALNPRPCSGDKVSWHGKEHLLAVRDGVVANGRSPGATTPLPTAARFSAHIGEGQLLAALFGGAEVPGSGALTTACCIEVAKSARPSWSDRYGALAGNAPADTVVPPPALAALTAPTIGPCAPRRSSRCTSRHPLARTCGSGRTTRRCGSPPSSHSADTVVR